MRIRVTAATAAMLLAVLTACGGDGGESSKKASGESKSAASKKVDCADEGLSQAEWLEHCSEGSGTGGDGTMEQVTSLKFGESYSWPDRVKVSVIEARTYTDFDTESGESAKPGDRHFRLKVKVTNGGKTPFDLSDLSTLVDGATTGGTASSTIHDRGSDPLEGRLGVGVTVTKTDDNVLATKYGRKVIVTVQRASGELTDESPEFSGSIAD